MDSSWMSNTSSLLKKIDEIVRNSIKNPAYFNMADAFASSWGSDLSITNDMDKVSAANTVAIDTRFELASSAEELEQVFLDTYNLTNLGPAWKLLEQHNVTSKFDLDKCIHVYVATITTLGYQKLEATNLEDTWLSLWQKTLHEYLYQQKEYSNLSLTPSLTFPASTDFASGVEEYLEKFGETGALTTAIVGAFPFSSVISTQLLSGLMKITQHLVPLYRLVQDLRFDPEDRLSTGIYAIASERDTHVGKVLLLLQNESIMISDIEARLRTIAQDYIAKVEDKVRAELLQYPVFEAQVLENVTTKLLGVANKLIQGKL